MKNKKYSPRISDKKTYVDYKGYRRFKDSNALVHRWIAENMLGRELRFGEVVHHKNRNKQDNSPGNLHVFGSQREHWSVHKYDARIYGLRYSMVGKNKLHR